MNYLFIGCDLVRFICFKNKMIFFSGYHSLSQLYFHIQNSVTLIRSRRILQRSHDFGRLVHPLLKVQFIIRKNFVVDRPKSTCSETIYRFFQNCRSVVSYCKDLSYIIATNSFALISHHPIVSRRIVVTFQRFRKLLFRGCILCVQRGGRV